MTKFIPEGWQSVTPRLVAQDVGKLVEFLKEAFGGTGELRTDRPCEIRIGDSLVMVSGVGIREAMPAFLYLYVADTDATYESALKAGGASLEEPQDMPYGDRRCMIKDPGGNIWQIATHNEEAFKISCAGDLPPKRRDREGASGKLETPHQTGPERPSV